MKKLAITLTVTLSALVATKADASPCGVTGINFDNPLFAIGQLFYGESGTVIPFGCPGSTVIGIPAPPVVTPPVVTPPVVTPPVVTPPVVTPGAPEIVIEPSPAAPAAPAPEPSPQPQFTDTFNGANGLAASLIKGAAISMASQILYDVITGKNRPPVDCSQLTMEGFRSPSGKAYRYQPGKVNDFKLHDGACGLRGPAADKVYSTPVFSTGRALPVTQTATPKPVVVPAVIEDEEGGTDVCLNRKNFKTKREFVKVCSGRG